MTQQIEGFGTFEIQHTTQATAEEVFDAFVNPEKIAAWFGPVGWEVPMDTIEIDPQPGGVYTFAMVNTKDETQQSPVKAHFDEIRRPNYIRSTEHISETLGFPADLVMETFIEETPEGTVLRLVQSPLPEAVFEPAAEGWKSSFTKLDAVLAATRS